MFQNGQVLIGANDAVTTSWVDLWKQNIVRTDPSTAVYIGVASSSANDTAAGTGARTVLLEGLSSTYEFQSEIVTLNGQTKVSSVNKYLRVNRLEVLTVGSGGVNAGDVYAADYSDTFTAGVPQTATKIFCRAQLGLNNSQMGMFTVPSGQRYELATVQFFLADATATAKYGKARIAFTKGASGVYLYQPLGGVGSPAGTLQLLYEHVGIIFEPKSDIKFQAIASAAGGEAVVHAELRRVA